MSEMDPQQHLVAVMNDVGTAYNNLAASSEIWPSFQNIMTNNINSYDGSLMDHPMQLLNIMEDQHPHNMMIRSNHTTTSSININSSSTRKQRRDDHNNNNDSSSANNCPGPSTSSTNNNNTNPNYAAHNNALQQQNEGDSSIKRFKSAVKSNDNNNNNNNNLESKREEEGNSGCKGGALAADNHQSSAAKPSSEPPSNKQDYIHVRARRGQATDSHSLAERARREKISERMKILQELVPNCNKVIGKALVLDEIINYVQSLQRQVEFLSMKLEAVNTKPSIEGYPSKDFAQQTFDASSMAFGSQSAREYVRGSSPDWLHMQIGGGFERTS